MTGMNDNTNTSPMFAVTGTELAGAAVRPGTERWVEVGSDGHVVFRGDATGTPILYVYCDGNRVMADPSPALLFDHAVARGARLCVSSEAVSHFLTCGLIPFPLAIFRDVFALGIGDQLHATRKDGRWTGEHRVQFPYFSEQSTGESMPDAKRLLSLLTRAVERQTADMASPTLMLSSGKDSTALAACLAELGRRDVKALTFVAETDRDEDAYAKALCGRLGLSHERVCVPRNEPFPPGVMQTFFSSAPLPCADDCQIPYLYAMSRAAGSGGILDGSGNDVYMGHVPGANDRRRDRLRIKHRRLARALELFVPCSTRAAQLLRHDAELCFLLGLFRGHEVRQFYGDYVDTDAFWAPSRKAFGARDVFDFRAVIRGRHYDQGSCALKGVTASSAFGLQCVFPWCDDDVIQYYFNLPETSRFDRRGFVNKVLVREMLHHAVDYPDSEIGKRYFQFDRVSFFLANVELVRSEILECSHWEGTRSERLLSHLYKRLPRNPRVGVALNCWFLLSGWLNHNRWLNP